MGISQAGKSFLASSTIDTLAVLFGYAALAPDNYPTVTKIGIGVIIIIAIFILKYVVVYSPRIKYKDKKLSTFFEKYLYLIEKEVEDIATGDVSVRANIMRPNRRLLPRFRKKFTIAYYNSEEDYRKGELDLTFEMNEGVVGSTYDTGTESLAIGKSQTDGWDDGWRTTPKQDRLTDHLETIIGVPIYRPSDDQEDNPVAVLIIDSEDPITEFIDSSGRSVEKEFKNSELDNTLNSHASKIGILL